MILNDDPNYDLPILVAIQLHGHTMKAEVSVEEWEAYTKARIAAIAAGHPLMPLTFKSLKGVEIELAPGQIWFVTRSTPRLRDAEEASAKLQGGR